MNSDLPRRYILFLTSLIIISFGIAIITKASLGTSPVTTISLSLSMVFPLTLGNFVILYSCLLVTIQAILMWRRMDRREKVDLIIEYGVSFVFGYLVDFAMFVFDALNPSSYPLQILTVLIGIAVMSFGIYIQVLADVIMDPADGFAYALTIRTHRSYGKIRVLSDSVTVIVAALIGLIGLGTLGGVREGTIICCIVTGTLTKQYMKHLSGLGAILVPGRNLNTIADGGK